jgi:hypothetical protein
VEPGHKNILSVSDIFDITPVDKLTQLISPYNQMQAEGDDRYKTARGKGWEGEEMEIAHQREERLRGAGSRSGKEKYQTVNLDQFRNDEVGVGFQARGVQRQKTGMDDRIKIIDMTKNDSPHQSDESRDNEAKRKKTRHRKNGSQEDGEDSIQKYLQCQALRDFRKEIEKILSETKHR